MTEADVPSEEAQGAWLLDTPAPDDAGAQTQSAFHYQHECTARACIPMLVRDRVTAVVCEEHEDCVVFYDASPPELVSIKHRDGSRGPWSLDALCSDGGIGHLFSRWLATGKRAGCRLVTNGSLKPGKHQAREMADACHSRDAAAIEPFVAKLSKKITASDDDVREFLNILSFDAGLPEKGHISSVNVTQLVVPALEALKLDPSLAQGVYDRLVGEIARANRDATGEPSELLRIIADPKRLDQQAVRDRRLRRRTIRRDDVAAVLFPRETAPAQLALGGDDDTPPASRLRQKLEAGGLGPTAVDTAIELRASWYGFESRRRNDLPGGDPVFDDLRLRVRELVGLSESRAAMSGQPYGARMHLDVRGAVTTNALPANTRRLPLDDQLLQGLVYQLTDECKVWWSPKFELRPT